MNNSAISLYELNGLIKNVLSSTFSDAIWIRAELSDVRVNQNGHCYLEFLEKDESNHNIIAKARAIIWANTFRMLKIYFESETGQVFTSGLKVLVQVSVEFHEQYGFNLTVHDIDPNYTLGDLARNRAMILKRLEEDGVLNLNKELELPTLTQRIAIISSPTAAGYEDFQMQLHHNTNGFVFYSKLFPSIMQGDRTEASMMAALEKIYTQQENFDAVVIIRGGGASSDLSCFDSYLLAASCAQFSLPIITGIGHERDDSVLDLVAHTRAKTPTAVAEFLIKRMEENLADLLYIQQTITRTAEQHLQDEGVHLNTLSTHLSYLLKGKTKEQLVGLENLKMRLSHAVQTLMTDKAHDLKGKEQYLNLISPATILKKGYTLTTKNNRIVKHASDLRSEDSIVTHFADGQIQSTVI